MLLRGMLVMVVLLNLGFFAWSQHWLGAIGLAPVEVGEPERMQQQLRPEAVRVEKDNGYVPPSPAIPASDTPSLSAESVEEAVPESEANTVVPEAANEAMAEPAQ